MAASVPWYYIWTKEKTFFNEMIKTEIKESNLCLESIFVDQPTMTTRVDMLLQRLRDNLDKAPYILFTDVDIIIKPGLYDALAPYLASDSSMVFLNEGSGVNLGCMILKVCSEVIAFWERVQGAMAEKSSSDTVSVNELLPDYNGKWSQFDNQIFISNNTWNGISPFIVLYFLSSGASNELHFAEKIFYSAQHMNVDPYMKYVPEEIIPFIYTFQELLFKSYQEAKKEADAR